jgi:hypothetical protein
VKPASIDRACDPGRAVLDLLATGELEDFSSFP